MKLALGTAQFGLNYGNFGTRRRVEVPEVASILTRARGAGIELLDTARAYGQSETVLGTVRAADCFHIVTKCPPLARESDPVAVLRAAFESSCTALGVKRIGGYLLHNAEDIECPGVWDALEGLVATGRVDRIGVSVYGYDEAERLCRRFPLTLVQLPANVLVPWYAERGLPREIEVHVRSVFLQGFLLSDPAQLPERFQPWRATLETFHARAAQLGLTPQAAALGPLLQSPHVDRVIVGVESLPQLEQILEAVATIDPDHPLDLGQYPDVTTALTDPRTW